ncbi:MAG: indolepyruvate ferredoxin oxidoreductase family protein [Marinosulfonomonas sp.]
MNKPKITLHDKYDLEQDQILMNGTQALVRLMLMQKARDAAAGFDTAGYVTGYRGSPLGAVDAQMTRAKADLDAADVVFEEALNEDLGATAVWGTQQAELRGEGKFDGVFGLWYGKGPGVDRSGDVMRHANLAGTSPMGGVLMAMGDDHTGESSTTCHQSDGASIDASMPILSPAGVQEILDYGVYGYALSRYAGVWAGLKLMKDTVEVTSVVDGRPDRMSFVTPDIDLPEGGLNIRLVDHWVEQEKRLLNDKKNAAEAFAYANKIDKRGLGQPGARIGFVAAGKTWLDLVHALNLLGIDAPEAERLGLTTYKIGQIWPLDRRSFRDWAAGLDLIVVLEEKRKLIEEQIKDALFDDLQGRRVYGARKNGKDLFQTHFALDPVEIAGKLGEILLEEGCDTEAIRAGCAEIDAALRADNAPELASRPAYFCAGCPHSSSTKLPEGSRAYAGIGCHFLVQYMDRETLGFTQMGGEGANWIGESKFSKTPHVFQNVGDGTYNHSGLMAIRAAAMAGTNMTYKILFNDAVAMTGGQKNDGGLGAGRVAKEILGFGVQHVAVVYDEKEDIEFAEFPAGLEKQPRSKLQDIQERYRKISGVSVIIYVQTCAAEKRRRRKRGQFPDPDKRVFINPDICEGCGDCGVQSNCVAIVPLETELGRKRAIDQSSCNKDFSCLEGFCPAFVTVSGARAKQPETQSVDLGDLPMPELPAIRRTHNMVIAGIGGTGVVTIGAVLAMAAHMDGKGVGMMEMAGIAQKGGAVLIHCRIAQAPQDITAIRVAAGECDALIGGDLVVSAGTKTLGLTRSGRTGGVINTHETMTGAFTRDPKFNIPSSRLRMSLEARMAGGVAFFDASELSRKVFGDTLFANMIVLGACWQKGLVPLGLSALQGAIKLNGAAAEQNLKAFDLGRWAIVRPDAMAELLTTDGATQSSEPQDVIQYRADHLQEYQSVTYGKRYTKFLSSFEEPRLKTAVAKGYHKVLAYKDEYEVARLLGQTKDRVAAEFDGDLTLTHYLSPPVFAGKDRNGRSKKRSFGEGFVRFMPALAKLKWVRGTVFDPFGYTRHRRMERGLIRQYESDLSGYTGAVDQGVLDLVVELAELPLEIKGFGVVKDANFEAAQKRRGEILTALQAGPSRHLSAAE